MTDFDIQNLRNLKPAKTSCKTCYALFIGIQTETAPEESNLKLIHVKDDGWGTPQHLKCPVCGTSYRDSSLDSSPRFISSINRQLNIEKIIPKEISNHCHNLLNASDDDDFFGFGKVHSLSRFFLTLNTAESFVNLISYGISHQIIAALKMTALRGVSVRAVISNVSDELMKELEISKAEMTTALADDRWSIKAFSSANRFKIPHQKICIFDGLMAFKGSTNFTLNGLRNADSGHDMFERVTNIKEVIELNNKFFSPLWKSNDEAGKVYDFSDEF